MGGGKILQKKKSCNFYLFFSFQILNLLVEREQSYVLKQEDAKTQKVGSLLNVVTFGRKYYLDTVCWNCDFS